MTDFIYDTECYPNVWCIGFLNAETKHRYYFEISGRRNDAYALMEFCQYLNGNLPPPERNVYSPTPHRLVGYNNLSYDYPILHMILKNPFIASTEAIYEKSCAIFNDGDKPFAHTVWENEHIITQIDLLKIHHFDNVSKRTGLKDLEFNMGMESIEDLPFPPGKNLDESEINSLAKYMFHDIEATFRFYEITKKMIEAREQLSLKYNVNMLNFNDTKIGKEHFIREMEKASPGICYDYSSGRKAPRQTWRTAMSYRDIIFPYIRFDRPEFQELLTTLLTQEVTDTQSKEKHTVTINGFDYVFGLGGLHGSVSARIIYATDRRAILDFDVESYYPSVGIVNKLYPEHLSELFCEIYSSMKTERFKYTKAQPENAMYKLALNGSYGDTNNMNSPLYDPLYMLRTTINGQLMLAMLAESLVAVHSVEMIQANTDGLTLAVDRNMIPFVLELVKAWENLTGMVMERNDYKIMAIRDVNNYIAQYENGKMKHKGCYAYDLEWHKDFSHRIVAKCAEAVILHGANARDWLSQPDHNIYDFFGKAKVPRTSRLLAVCEVWGGCPSATHQPLFRC